MGHWAVPFSRYCLQEKTLTCGVVEASSRTSADRPRGLQHKCTREQVPGFLSLSRVNRLL